MTVKDFESVCENFQVVVKECSLCFKYECNNSNSENRHDFIDREIYKVFTMNDVIHVYCW